MSEPLSPKAAAQIEEILSKISDTTLHQHSLNITSVSLPSPSEIAQGVSPGKRVITITDDVNGVCYAKVAYVDCDNGKNCKLVLASLAKYNLSAGHIHVNTCQYCQVEFAFSNGEPWSS